MRILLTYPEDDEFEWCIQFPSQWNDMQNYRPETFYPMATAYLAAAVEQAGDYALDVLVAVPAIAYEEYVMQRIEQFQPDVIVITCLSTNRISVYRILRRLQQEEKPPTVILGGIHATYMCRQLLAHFPIIDFIVLGEGEHVLPQLLKMKEGLLDIGAISGIAYRRGDTIVVSDEYAYIEDINTLPWPAHHYFEKMMRKHKVANMLATRGCPNNCLFCCQYPYWAYNQRVRDPQSIADEMEYLNKTYGVNFIRFADDTFTYNRQWVLDLCARIKAKNLNLKWFTRTMVAYLDEEIIAAMADAGCGSIIIGVESGSDMMRENISKNFMQDDAIRISWLFKKYGIYSIVTFTIGNPGESSLSIYDTIRLIRRLNIDAIKVFTTSVAVGSRLWKEQITDKTLADSFWLSDMPCPIYTKEKPLWVLSLYRFFLIISYCLCKSKYRSLLKYICENVVYVFLCIVRIFFPRLRFYIAWKRIKNIEHI